MISKLSNIPAKNSTAPSFKSIEVNKKDLQAMGKEKFNDVSRQTAFFWQPGYRGGSVIITSNIAGEKAITESLVGKAPFKYRPNIDFNTKITEKLRRPQIDKNYRTKQDLKEFVFKDKN